VKASDGKNGGKGKAAEPSQWSTVTVMSAHNKVAYFSAENEKHCFKLETRWRDNTVRKGSACKAFICMSYLGEAKNNDWFVEMTVGSRHAGMGSALHPGRRMTWSGRVHDMKFSAKELEDRGEGMYLNGREMRAMRLTAGCSASSSSSSSSNMTLPLLVTVRSDSKMAALEQYRRPLPEPQGQLPSLSGREAQSNPWASSFAVLYQYLSPTTVTCRPVPHFAPLALETGRAVVVCAGLRGCGSRRSAFGS
jgi:hypothetical protein